MLPVIAGLGAALLAAPASAGGGSETYNTPVCTARYVPVDLGHGDYFNVYNAQGGTTCITVERRHLSWYVSSWEPAGHGWQYPNIGSGTEWGTYTCDDGPSARPSSPGSECMRYPVREKADGTPLTSVTVWPHIRNGNAAYDIWFNRSYRAPGDSYQDDGAEIMIWLAHPGVAEPASRSCWQAVIQGRWYDVMCWRARNPADGTEWNYVAYVAVRQSRSLPPTWLNRFFRDAIAHGKLSPGWWLTGIDFGAEINSAPPGAGFDVASYSLTGVR